MCAAYTIRGAVKDFEIPTGFSIRSYLPYTELDERIVPYRMAPVLIQTEQEYAFREMSFSLVPSWSKERKVKFATHNARLETVLEKPTWKRPFLSQRALIPISYFVEPIYEHELAGNMVQFSAKDSRYLYAAAIYDEWLDKQTGEILQSFSILTSEPPEFIFKTGHDRCPVFLKASGFEEWLVHGKQEPEGLMQTLSYHRDQIDFTVQIDRPLRPGWEKRR